MWILWAVIIGFVAGLLARAVVPGDDSMGLVATMVLGLAGSLIGGFLGYILFGRDAADGAFQGAGLIGSFIGAILALVAWRAYSSRSGHHSVTH